METYKYLDPLDYSQVLDARKTVVIGFSDPESQRNNVISITDMGLHVLDVYRNPAIMIPKLLTFPCFLRLIDYQTYKLIEDDLRTYLKHGEPNDLPLTIVYPGFEDIRIIDSPAVVNPAKLHPTMLSGVMCYMRHRGTAQW